MNLIEYYNNIKSKIRNNEYEIVFINTKSVSNKTSLHIEALNYMIYEWNEDHNDDRNDIFKYIIKPNNSDFDFTNITFVEFFDFLMLSKDKDNEVKIINGFIQKQEIKNDDILDEFWLR